MKWLYTLLLALPLGACATIMHGTAQDVGFSSSPTNAKVSVDNQPFGNTPVVVKLSRKDPDLERDAASALQKLMHDLGLALGSVAGGQRDR